MTTAWRIGIFAPSGQVLDPAAIGRAVERLTAAGHCVTVDATARGSYQRFAATDTERAAAFVRIAASDIDVAVAARGGYGCTRLLELLDFGAIARSRKRWLGHSDFTAFQLAALARAGMVSFAGPMASYDFGATKTSDYTLRQCWALLDNDRHALEFPVAGANGLSCSGRLWGGNLAMVAHLAGGPYLPAIEGGVLFLEDVAEHPYRIERMLYQLHFAGVLERQQAVLLGSFSGYALGANDQGYDLEAMLAHLRSRLRVPLLTGLPFGHCADKATLPVGGQCKLEVSAGRARLELTEYQP